MKHILAFIGREAEYIFGRQPVGGMTCTVYTFTVPIIAQTHMEKIEEPRMFLL